MWKLEKPSLESAKDDLREVTAHCCGLKDKDVPDFEALYEEYDINKGKINEEYHFDFIKSHAAQSKAMYNQYKKLNEGAELDYIRAELFTEAADCPLCGFGEPVTLDHFMPKSKYKELATCRLNLVPICWKCNHEKTDDDYQKFIHSYYQEFPKNVQFFKCNVSARVGGIIHFKFYIDDLELESTLKEKLENQVETIGLNKRLNKECITYITSNFSVDDIKDDGSLKFFIKDRLKKSVDNFGLNDWHTALLAGLYDCVDFNVAFLNDFIKSNRRKQRI